MKVEYSPVAGSRQMRTYRVPAINQASGLEHVWLTGMD